MELTTLIKAGFADPDRGLEDAVQNYEAHRQSEGAAATDPAASESTFQDSLWLKSELDRLEGFKAQSPSDASEPLALLLHCEYLLYRLNSPTPLRYNPFLSHWVEVVSTWQPKIREYWENNAEAATKREEAWSTMHRARLMLVRAILTEPFPNDIAKQTPASLCRLAQQAPLPRIDISRFISILEEEGIITREQDPSSSGLDSSSVEIDSDGGTSLRSMSKQDLHQRLRTRPEETLHALARLPIDMTSMEQINSVIYNGNLNALGYDHNDLVREYVQHALRIIERLGPSYGAPPTPLPFGAGGSTSAGPSNAAADRSARSGGDTDGQEEDVVPDRDAQIRGVQLLVMFIKNLIRRDMLDVSSLYFDIQEICVRYIFVPEVKTFRQFLEGGAFEV